MPQFNEAYKLVYNLIDDFKKNETHYLSPVYQEENYNIN